MKLYRNLKISQKALLLHKMRTLLALLGIIVGVSAVIIMVAIGNGARHEIVSQIEAMGTNLIIINAGDVRTFTGRQQIRGKVTTLTLQDAKTILRELSSVEAVVPVQAKKIKVKFNNYSTTTSIVGSMPNYPWVRNFNTVSGWFFSDRENRVSMRVAVLGQSVVENIFDNRDPLGSVIRIGKVPFQVIGVMEPKGVDMYGTDQDDQIFIPVNTALRRVFNQEHIEAIYLQIDRQENMASTLTGVKTILRQRHRLNQGDKPDDFIIQSQTDLIAAQEETSNTFTTLTASIAGISLLVGGFGILAVMLLSIRERRREIGLRMAMGARQKDVRIQFLFESAILSLGGGIIGIFIGISGALLLEYLAAWSISISLFTILLSFCFSLMIGLFFGVYPAHKASLLDPIVALHSE
ncbi:ABC transporter permease [bacterium]|nr:ABC transporter permease [bacterium]